MENLETKEEKLKKLFLQYLTRIKASLSQRVEYRVHGGNQVNELMTEFRTNREETVLSLVDQFLKNEFKEELTETELAGFKAFVESELEKYFNQIEIEAYTQLRKYIAGRYYETTGDERTVVSEFIPGNDIFLLGTDRLKFEQRIQQHFLSAEGPGRSNVYGLTAENMPKIYDVITEEVNKIVATKG